MKKLLSLVSMHCLLVGFAYAQEQTLPPKRLTLQECIRVAIANNADVLQSGLQSETQKINRNSARMNMLPDLNGSTGSGVNNGRSIDPYTNAYSNQEIRYSTYGINSSMTLFNGLFLQKTAQQTQLLFEATKLDYKNQQDKIAISIILNYLQVLSNEDQLNQATDQAVLSKKQVERLQTMNQEGAISPYLLSDLQGQLANDELNIINANNALSTAKLNLYQLMNVPYAGILELERIDTAMIIDNGDAKSPSDTYNAALNNLPVARAAELHVMSSEKGWKAARGRMFPLLTVNGNANTNYSSAAFRNLFVNNSDVPSQDYVLVNGVASPLIRKTPNYLSEKIGYRDQLKNNIFSSFSLNLSIPIFANSFYRNSARLAKITLQGDKLLANTTRTRLQLAIEQAYIDRNSAAERFRTLQKQVNAFRESFRSAEIRFNEGVVNSVDYLAAKNNLDRANINYISAKYELVLRKKVLDYYEGTPMW